MFVRLSRLLVHVSEPGFLKWGERGAVKGKSPKIIDRRMLFRVVTHYVGGICFFGAHNLYLLLITIKKI